MLDGNHHLGLLAAAQTRGFAPFLPLHAVVLAVFALVVWALVAAGREAHRHGRGPALDRWLGAAALCIWLAVVAYWLVPERITIGISLPLHLCDLANLVAALAFLLKARFWRVILHYWAFALCTQAFITPTLELGPSDIYFWIFWAYHFAVVGLATYDIAVRGFSTTWRDFAAAYLGTLAWCIFVFVLNIRFGTNYGYVGELQSATTTIISALGPWPWRVGVLGVIVLIAFALITLLGQVARSATARRPSPALFQTPSS